MADNTQESAATPPHHILGYTIRSRTRIYVYYLTPAILELGIYITQIVADCAVSYQHFISRQPGFGWATLALILVPPVLTFIFVVSSRDQWANPKNANRWKFLSCQLLQLFLFPLVAVYRNSVRVFWSMEALFHDDDDSERMLSLAKAEECSTCELYRLIQAYGQSAPQIILQLYHMLSQDIFRNFQTTHVQAVSLMFSAIDMAAITTTYQRFESQRLVGRAYPWSPPHVIESHQRKLAQNECLRRECADKKRDSEHAISRFPESDKIMTNFNMRHNADDIPKNSSLDALTHEVRVYADNEVDNDALELNETEVLMHKEQRPVVPHAPITSTPTNATDDDKSQLPKLRFSKMRKEMQNLDEIEILDTVPDTPAPLPPPLRNTYKRSSWLNVPPLRSQTSQNSDTTSNSAGTRQKYASKTFSQLENWSEMLMMDAQLYIKEHVPHPPKLLIKRLEEQEKKTNEEKASKELVSHTPMTPEDVVDFFLPRPTKVVIGIAQDDFAGKTVAFFGWISYLVMRMLSLCTFCVFYVDTFFIVLGVQYMVMFGALFLETRFRGSLNRTLFYMLLAYVYTFVILEFRVKFKHLRTWYVSYFLIIMVENITMTAIWYTQAEFDSWWFDFIFKGIIYSGVLFLATLLVYYCILQPRNVTLIVEDEDNSNKNTS